MITTSLNPTLAARFAWLFDGLCKMIGADAHKRRMEAALAWAVWNRVRLLGERLVAIATRVRSGRLRPARATVASPREARPAAARPAASLPRQFGWIRKMLPETAQFAGVLSCLLRDPETSVLVQQAPEAGRVLRPLCHLLGVTAPDFLRRRRGAAESLSPPPPGSDAGGALATTEVPEAAPPPAVAQMPPEQSPPPAPSAPPATAPPPRPHHLRPGGLYWDGRGLRWA